MKEKAIYSIIIMGIARNNRKIKSGIEISSRRYLGILFSHDQSENLIAKSGILDNIRKDNPNVINRRTQGFRMMLSR